MWLVWRAIAFLSITANIVIVIMFSYAVWAYGDNINILLQRSKIEMPKDFNAIVSAAMIGRLDMVSLVLTTFGILLAFMAFAGFFIFRREAIEIAGEEAKRVAPGALIDYMNEHGTSLIRKCLDDDTLVAQLHSRIEGLGLEDAEDVDDIESDWDWRPTDADEPT